MMFGKKKKQREATEARRQAEAECEKQSRAEDRRRKMEYIEQEIRLKDRVRYRSWDGYSITPQRKYADVIAINRELIGSQIVLRLSDGEDVSLENIEDIVREAK